MTDDAPDDRPEYSVGPLPNRTWLAIYHMLSIGLQEADEVFAEEFQAAKEDFLLAHPEGAIGDPDDWPEAMKESWNEVVWEAIEEI